jgi:hypothetical protein
MTEQNRIPLRETVRRPYDETAEYSDTISGIEDSLIYYRGGVKDVQAELDRVRKMAPNSPLVKQYEDKLAVMRDKVDELEAQLDSTKPAKFGPDIDPSYSTPGGENYREIRVGLPSRRPSIKNMSREDYNAAIERADREGIRDFMHESHHDNEPNVLFHLRVADHVDEEGKKGLLIDELQSDWHQKGRDKGYITQLSDMPLMSADELYDKHYVNLTSAQRTYLRDFMKRWDPAAESGMQDDLDRLANEYENWVSKQTIFKGVPNAPFKDNWYQLGLKRAIKEAADTGMDRVYLTTGARQADRYDLSKQIGYLSIDPRPNGMVRINASKDGDLVINKEVPKDQLADYVGKDMAKKAISDIDAGKSAQYSDLDLKVGGEGMKQYYDKTYKNFLEKYAKQHGGKLGETRLPGAALTRDKLSSREIEKMMDNPEFKKILDEEFVRVANELPVTGKVEPQGDGNFKIVWSDGTMMGGYSEESAKSRLALGREFRPTREAKAWNAALERFGGEPVYYIDITDAMRETAKKGQRYAQGGSVFNTDPDITDAGRIIPDHTI